MPILVVWLLVSLTYFCPLIDSTRAPYPDLSAGFSQLQFWLAESGGPTGATLLALICLLVLVTRGGITHRRRSVEALSIAAIVGAVAGGGAALNEHVIKNRFAVPRPNIEWLATANAGETLQMSAVEFYALGSKEDRREYLTTVLDDQHVPLGLSEKVVDHWLTETGYSFPSGHAFSALFFLTFFLTTAVWLLRSRRVSFFYLLLPWALAVCYSRPILRVHTPTDIAVGGLQGLILGLLAFWMLSHLLGRWFGPPTQAETKP